MDNTSNPALSNQSQNERTIVPPELIPSKENKLINKNKFKIAAIIIFVIFLLGSTFYVYVNRQTFKSLSNKTDEEINNLTEEAIIENIPNITRETKYLAFIRDGDVWLKDIASENEEDITSHPELKIKSRHTHGGQWITDDYSNEFYQLPKLSPDGRFLVFLGVNRSIFDDIKDYDAKLAAESEEQQNSGSSIAFYPPGITYSWNVYDIDKKVNVEPIIDENIQANEDMFWEVQNGPFGSVEWSNKRLNLSFTGGANSYMLKVEYSPDNTPIVKIINTGNSVCGLLCMSSTGPYTNDTKNFWVRSSPDGTKLLLSVGQVKDLTNVQERSQVPSGCHGPAWADETLVFDNDTGKLIYFSKEDLCRVYIGDWYKNNQDFISVESYADKTSWFVTRSIISPTQEPKKLFRDDSLFYNSFNSPTKSPLYLSPNNEYIAYFSGDYEAENTGGRDLRIRNLKTLEYFDVVTATQKQTNEIQ